MILCEVDVGVRDREVGVMAFPFVLELKDN